MNWRKKYPLTSHQIPDALITPYYHAIQIVRKMDLGYTCMFELYNSGLLKKQITIRDYVMNVRRETRQRSYPFPDLSSGYHPIHHLFTFPRQQLETLVGKTEREQAALFVCAAIRQKTDGLDFANFVDDTYDCEDWIKTRKWAQGYAQYLEPTIIRHFGSNPLKQPLSVLIPVTLSRAQQVRLREVQSEWQKVTKYESYLCE